MHEKLHPAAWLNALAVTCALSGCAPDQATEAMASDSAGARVAILAGTAAKTPGVHRQYGTPVRVGEGMVRTYVVVDAKEDQRPLELGVAIDARTMDGAMPSEMLMIPMSLPQHAPAPYRFVLFDWNPAGHAPPGVFDAPHFDVHFYFVPQSDVDAITPEDPEFASKANNLPTGDYVPPLYVVGKPPGATPANVAFPMMGVHWQDLLSPEYQRILGRPDAYRPFTRTYVYVSWDGRFTALEPMITREYLLRRTTETVPVRQPTRYPEAGWYPRAYRIEYDDRTREYRIALVDFVWHE